MTAALTQMHWYTQPGIAFTRFPRCYNIHNSENLEEFIEDFRLNACISLIKWLSIVVNKKGDQLQDVQGFNGKVPFTAIEFALNRLDEFIKFNTHRDIDETEDQAQHIWEHEWDQFLTYHYLLVHERSKLIEDNAYNIR